ncbi:hypothetical protein IMCC1989_2098 [gamma proteobacterium IMCC1989]|nr:hypothetical protein IMCC1989_2098 [gamma proteobacterium IMCC1989]
MIKLFILILPFLPIIVLLGQIDDDLSPKATELINTIEVDVESDAYLYLLGFSANENDSPEKVGVNLLNEYRKQESDNSYAVVDYSDAKKIPLPQGEFFCKTWEEGCLATLFVSDIDINKLKVKYSALLARLNRFHEFNEYKTLTKPSPIEQYPPYKYILAAERLEVLYAIATYKSGKSKQAISLLQNQLAKVRKSLRLQDNLIGKMAFLIKASEIIDVLSVIIAQTGADIKAIPELTISEKDFSEVSTREFAVSYYLFKALDRNPELFRMGGNLPSWFTRIVFKPNMTINTITPDYYRLVRISRLKPAEFVNELGSDRPSTSLITNLRNYVGNVLIGISTGYDEYVARVMDFETKIHLFNRLHHYQDELGAVSNPYYPSDKTELSGGNACFRGPLEDKRFLRCIKIKI